VIDNGTVWAVVVIAVVPLAVIAASEVDERLRQRESPLRSALGVLRGWALPFFAIWAILVPVLGRTDTSLFVRIIASGLVLALSVGIIKILKVIIDRIRNRPQVDGRGSVPQLLLAMPRIGVVLITAGVLLGGVWGIDLSAILTTLGVTSLVVSFALQDTLSGLASGVLLLSDQPFQTGDWIRAGDTEGLVLDINWRTSRIRTRNGDLVIVPNSELAGASVLNFSTPEPLHRVVVALAVAYVNPPTSAKEMLLDAARNTPGVLSDPPPNVRIVTIDDPVMGYEVDMWVNDYSIVPRVESDFGSLVWYQSHRHDVPLPSPAQDLFIHDAAAEDEASKPKPGDIRRSLQRTPLLGLLSDDDLDRIVPETRPLRYAVGELMIDSQSTRQELMIIVEGQAVLELIEPGFDNVVIGEVGGGESVGMLEGLRGEARILALRAVTDCEVLVVGFAAAGEIGSRNADLAAAFNRMSAVRQRRVQRVVTARAAGNPEADTEQTDDPVSEATTESAQ
jgi:small-conductance mechanosensitive channel/CRP-like cAMP-binding protein